MTGGETEGEGEREGKTQRETETRQFSDLNVLFQFEVWRMPWKGEGVQAQMPLFFE